MPSVSEVRAGALPLNGQRAPSGGSSGFTLPNAADQPAARAATAPPVLAVPAGALALQEIGVEAPQERAARRRGHDLLAALRALQRALLARGLNQTELLGDLATLTRDVPVAADPQLRGVVDALVLRARVELARRGL